MRSKADMSQLNLPHRKVMGSGWEVKAGWLIAYVNKLMDGR